jgi:hypothetical protein
MKISFQLVVYIIVSCLSGLTISQTLLEDSLIRQNAQTTYRQWVAEASTVWGWNIHAFAAETRQRYFSNVAHATIITKIVRDWKKLEMIAQEYTYPFASISISISSYNQIEQREFLIRQTTMTHVWQQRYDRNILISRKTLKLLHPDFNCRMLCVGRNLLD